MKFYLNIDLKNKQTKFGLNITKSVLLALISFIAAILGFRL